MNYFKNHKLVEDIKKAWRDLAKQFHPDLGGDLELMKLINHQYHEALKACNLQKSYDNSNREHTYTYNYDVEQAVIDKIHELLALRLPAVTISLIGTWIWIQGETKPAREALKASGCKWSGDKQCWYWHGGKFRRRYSKDYSLGDIASRYGYREFSDNQKAIG